MSEQREIDDRPGRLPDIRRDGTGITFEFAPTTGEHGARLVIRCDENGDVLARIAVHTDRRRSTRSPD
jgi:hypothetical protein